MQQYMWLPLGVMVLFCHAKTAPSIAGVTPTATPHDNVLQCIFGNPQTKEFAEVLGRPEFQDLAALLSASDESKIYTVMAPNNEAMAQMASLSRITDVPMKEVLRYHIMPGLVTSSMVDSLHFAPSTYIARGRVQGMKLARTATGQVQVSSGPLPPATVTNPDIHSNNGVVHVIDRMLIPPFSVAETLRYANLTHFLAFATHNDLIVTMDKASGGTVFAPTNEAIDDFVQSQPTVLKDDDAIYDLVKAHFAPKQIRYSTRISTASPASLTTLSGTAQIARVGDNLKVNSVTVRRADLITRFGVLYVLDGLLIENRETNDYSGTTREAVPIPDKY